MECLVSEDPLKAEKKVSFSDGQNIMDALQNGGLEPTKHNSTGPASATFDEDVLVEESTPLGKAKKRHRRGSKRNKPRKPRQKYKPYHKLTWDEKRKLDERDAVKALKRREELVLQKGRAIAPYNTTQFLMQEHDPNDMIQEEQSSHQDSSSSYSSDEYFDKDFEDFYDRVHIDTLNSYTKEDLIKHVYELEKRVENLERERNSRNTEHLKAENLRLATENERLKQNFEKKKIIINGTTNEN